ncbi:MAG: tetratricopeptide repeat protein [Chitinophagaceae bacterium]|nr:tetratricopeptide repeat protein [Chitinophagaceae bacterium]
MKKIICVAIFSLLLCSSSNLFSQTARELHETARSFMQQGDYANAVLILNRAVQLAPDNIDIAKDLSFNYYLQKDFIKALEVIKPLLDREDADDQCYQIAGNIYKQLEQVKECDKLFRKGIRKFPESGAMYNELGELLWAQQDYSAIKQWEKGIEVDPGFSKNYYNASKYYFLTTDKVWSIIYGEIFINMEPISKNAPEIKAVLLDGYKKLFSDARLSLPENEKNKFTEAFIKTMNKQSSVAANGINAETLTMIRSRFILDWYYEYADKLPFKLFELQQQLLQNGMFDVYNQWIFGSVQNLAAYQNWTIAHAAEYDEFTKLQRGRVFKFPSGQYYH